MRKKKTALAAGDSLTGTLTGVGLVIRRGGGGGGVLTAGGSLSSPEVPALSSFSADEAGTEELTSPARAADTATERSTTDTEPGTRR